MQFDFSGVKDPSPLDPVPQGDYLVEVEAVAEKLSKQGAPYWKLTLRIVGGSFAGRCLFDSLHFNEKALPRVRLVFSRIGLDVEGKVNVEPRHLIGRRAIVTVKLEEYQDKLRNEVTYEGWKAPPAPAPTDDGIEPPLPTDTASVPEPVSPTVEDSVPF
jgi:hypothetical protein